MKDDEQDGYGCRLCCTYNLPSVYTGWPTLVTLKKEDFSDEEWDELIKSLEEDVGEICMI